MNNHHALFVAIAPGITNESEKYRTDYGKFLDIEDDLKQKNETDTMITRGIWLIPLATKTHVLSVLVQKARQYNIEYRVAYFDNQIEWCS